AIGEIAEDLGAAALERNVHEIETGAFGEDFSIDLLIAADAGAAVTDLARVFAGVGEKVGERGGGKIRRGREEEDRDIRQRGNDLNAPLVVDFHFFLRARPASTHWWRCCRSSGCGRPAGRGPFPRSQ